MRAFTVHAPVGAIPKRVERADFRTLGLGCELAGGAVVVIVGQLDMRTEEGGLVSGLLVRESSQRGAEPPRSVVVWYDTQAKVLRTTPVTVHP